MSSGFELSEDTVDRIDAVRESSDLPADSSIDKVIRTLANEHLIRHGNTEELGKIKEEKRQAEAKREALREWLDE